MSDAALGALEAFRIGFAGRPLLLVLAAMALMLLARRLAGRPVIRDWSIATEIVIAVSALAALIAYGSVAIWYASNSHFFDNAEPVIPIVGWLFHTGGVVYPGIASPERYAHIYGPFAFIAHGWVLGLFGPGIRVSKALGVVMAFASIAMTYLLARRHTQRPVALIVTGMYALLLLQFRHYSFWTRPEPLQLLAVSTALFCVVRWPGFLGATTSGAAMGVLWNLKITGPLYTLPMFALLQRQSGWKPCAVAFATAAAVALFPFAYYTNVSWTDYLAWLRLSGSTGLLLSTLRQNVEWALYSCLPVLLSYYAAPQAMRPATPAWRNMIAALAVGITGVVIAASKPGAGPYHLLPFLPIVIYLVAWRLALLSAHMVVEANVGRACTAFVVTAVFIATAQEAQFVTTMRERGARNEGADIIQFADSHPGVTGMGYGSTESLSLQRPLLAFRSNSYLLDQPAIREYQLQGVELPPATLHAIAACRVNYWLIPKGEAPFSGRNSYSAVLSQPLYSEEFRRVFARAHSIVGATRYYDVWQCHGASDR